MLKQQSPQKAAMHDPIDRIQRTRRVSIKPLPAGLEITIPSRAELANWFSKTLYFFLLAILTLMVVGLVPMFLIGAFFPSWEVRLFMLGLACFCIAVEFQALYDFFGQERIVAFGCDWT